MQYVSNVPQSDLSDAATRSESIRVSAHPYHHGDLRNALLSTARAMLEDDPSSDLSLRAVARAAGVSHAAPYRHFASQQDLLAALAAEGFMAMSACFADVGVAPSPDMRIASLCRSYFGFVVKHRALARLMFGSQISDRSRYPELVAASAGTVAEIGRVLGAVDLALPAFAVLCGFSMLSFENAIGIEAKTSAEGTMAHAASVMQRMLHP